MDLIGFTNVLLFLVMGCLFVGFVTFFSRLLHRQLHGNIFSEDKFIAYECGEEPAGDARVKFNVRFYIIALIFLIFDVEIVFMFPWGVIFRSFPSRILAFAEMLFFIAVLLVGLAYVWAKGDLEWIKTTGKAEVPNSLLESERDASP